jgi:hypothetical protein
MRYFPCTGSPQRKSPNPVEIYKLETEMDFFLARCYGTEAYAIEIL